MAKERRPLLCDIWNRPWPPKYVENPPVRKPAPPSEPEPPRDEGPLPPPTRENWIALVLGGGGLVFLFALGISEREGGFVVPPILYLGLVTGGAFRVRPRTGHGRAFFAWTLPVLVQLAMYALLAWEAAAISMDPNRSDATLLAMGAASGAAFCLAWIPAFGLFRTARRGELLLLAETVGGVLALLFLAVFMGGRA